MSARAPRLYAIADSQTLGSAALPTVVRSWAEQGIEWIQLRIKAENDLDLFKLVETCVETASGYEGLRLWINDRADVASLFPVFGLHLGQTDLPPDVARQIIGEQKQIGFSTHTLEQVREADLDPAVDLIAIGPVYGTRSKLAPDPVVGLEGVRQARSATEKPLVAIGGVGAQNALAVLEAGADSVAVIGALSRGDVGENARRMLMAVV